MSSVRFSLSDIVHLQQQIKSIAPDLIIHTAALTNVDECERDMERTYQTNVEIACNVASAASSLGIKLVHLSTDSLFSGEQSLMSEQTEPFPLNRYAQSKLKSEQLVQKICPEALILRTNFFCWGHRARQSFSDWIIYSLRGGHRLSLFDDVYFTPVLADELVRLTHELILMQACGIFNVSGNERLSKYQFGIQLAKQFNLPVNLISSAKSENAGLLAARPKDMSLLNHRLVKHLGRKLNNMDQYFSELIRQEKEGRRKELFYALIPEVSEN